MTQVLEDPLYVTPEALQMMVEMTTWSDEVACTS
jgi:hypothetical protein